MRWVNKFIIMYIAPILGSLVCYLFLRKNYEKMKSRFENDPQVLTCVVENIEKKPYDYSTCSVLYILTARDKFGGQLISINYSMSLTTYGTIRRQAYTCHEIPKVGDEIKVISQNGELISDYNLKSIERYKKLFIRTPIQYIILSLYVFFIFHKMILGALILSILLCIVSVIKTIVFNDKTSHKE